MNTTTVVGRVLTAFAAGCVTAGTFACTAAPYGVGLRSTFTPQAPAPPARTSESKPDAPDSKPMRLENDDYERHPAHWRKKLRAKYA